MRLRISPALILPCLLLVVGGLLVFHGVPTPRQASESAGSSGTPAADTVKSAAPEEADFREWRTEHAVREMTPELLADAKVAAAAHKERMLEWMRQDPARALEEALSWSEYAALPEELKPYFEKPFNEVATLNVMPICHPEAKGGLVRTLELGTRHYRAEVTGKRVEQTSKSNTPLAGITLEDQAVISELPLEPLSGEDAALLAGHPDGQRRPDRDFASGEALGRRALTALAGGKLYRFRDQGTLDEFNRRLAKLDEAPGPHAGARVLWALADADGGDEGFQWDEAEAWNQQQASAWTETPKNLLYIRADFSDRSGASFTQPQLEEILNTTVSNSIRDMSYGKTRITATVTPMVVRLPLPSTSYLPDKNVDLHMAAKAAYEAIAGPNSLNGYDIVVACFPEIGIQSGGVNYAGLATIGGVNQWLQGNASIKNMIHELGHNYGITHASYWQTTDGSSVGSGNTDEYGDIFDMMGTGPGPKYHFHPQGKVTLNWLTPQQLAYVTASNSSETHRIYRFDSPATTGALRGIRVLRDALAGDTYWIGYRAGVPGFEALGAYLIWQRPNSTKGWLVDTTPGSPGGKYDAPIAIGRTYSDAAAGVYITPLAKGGSGEDAWLDVHVKRGSFPSNTAPTVSLASPGTVSARTPVTLTANASDADGDELAYLWDFGDGTTSKNTPSPEQSWGMGGTYTVKVTVSDMKGKTATATMDVVVSDPAIQWSEVAGLPGYDLTAPAYLNGRFLMGANGQVLLSMNGTDWEGQSVSNVNPAQFASSGNSYVSITGPGISSGSIYSSADGKKWKLSRSVSSPSKVVYGNGAYLVMGPPSTSEEGFILRSTDEGQTWTEVTLPPDIYPSCLVYGDGVFLLAGRSRTSPSPACLSSTDGINWVDRSATFEGSSEITQAIHWKGAFYVAVPIYGRILRSTDGGVSWEIFSVAGATIATTGSSTIALQSVTGSADFILMTGIAGTTRYHWVGTDGVRWSQLPALPNFTVQPVYADGRLVSALYPSKFVYTAPLNPGNTAPSASVEGPSQLAARETAVFQSTSSDPDGDPLRLIWDFNDGSPLVEGVSSCSHRFVAGGTYEVKFYAIDGRGGVATVKRTVTVADPLLNWTQRSSGTTANLNAIAAGNGKLVAVGAGNGTYRTSTDGAIWTGGTIGANVTLNGVCHDGSQFIACGTAPDPLAEDGISGAIYTSPDGTAWTQRHLGGADLRKVACGGGCRVVVGDAGMIWRSVDGLSWSPQSSGTTQGIVSVAWGAGHFVAIGSLFTQILTNPSGPILTSPDGIAWSDVTSSSPGYGGWNAIGFGKDRFLCSGGTLGFRYSVNGGSAFKRVDYTDKFSATGFAYSRGIYFACGLDSRVGAAKDANFVSVDGADWRILPTSSQQDRTGVAAFQDCFVTVGRSGSIWQSAVLPPPAGSGYEAWQQAHFPDAPPLSGADDDFDQDGLPNLAEYATGSDPRDAGSLSQWQTAIEDGYFIVTVPKAEDRDDVAARMEFSTSLSGWSSNGVIIVEDSATRLVAKVPMGVTSGFLRPVFELE